MKMETVIRDQIVDHAKRGAPIEVCGYLAGKDGVITRHYELTNVDQSQEHFSFDPKEQFATVKSARAEGLEIYAVYHSHPATPARPSQEDIRLAYDPNISYVIVSLADGKEDVKAFHIRDGEVAPDTITLV